MTEYKLLILLDNGASVVPYTGTDAIVARAAFMAYCDESNVEAADLMIREFGDKEWNPIRSFDSGDVYGGHEGYFDPDRESYGLP